MITRFRAPTRRIAHATAQIGIRPTVSSMSKYHTSYNTSSVLNERNVDSLEGTGIDQTWDSSRGIKFQELLNEETSPNFHSCRPIEERLNVSSSTIHRDLADTRSEDYVEDSQDRNVAKNCTSPTDKVELGPHEDLKHNVLSAKSPLGYYIPEAKMRNLMLSPSAYWHYSLYEGPKGEKIKIHYCKSKETTDRVAHLFLDQKIVGFDIEWKPHASPMEGIRKNVALIQLASEERIALFHLARFYKQNNTIGDLLAPNLQKVLESPDITKVGVAVKGDCTRLRRFLGIDSRGLFELSHLYKLVRFSTGDVKKINKVLVSLAQQVHEHLHLPLWKGEVRNSDWSQELDYEQIRYAASDSYAGFQLYHILESKRKALSPTPPRPAHAELNRPILLANGQTVATYDEPTETNEVLSSHDPETAFSVEEMARDFVNIAIEELSVPSSDSNTSELKHCCSAASVLGPEVSAANSWVVQWRSTLSPDYKPRASTYQLRAYALWHEQQHAVITTAALLRNPPLQTATVATYILEALRTERLPFEVARLVEVLKYLPVSSQARYGSFLKRSGVTKNLEFGEKKPIHFLAREEKQC